MQFSVLVPIDMRRDARAALLELQFYASSLVQTLHRRRALVPDSTKFMRVMQSSKRAKTALEPYTQTWLAQSGAKQQLGKFRSRRVRQLAQVEGASGRAEVEDRELSRWRQELARLVVEADLPVLEPMLLVRNQESALIAALGNARASTIRKRVREWRKVRAYCLAVSGSAWPAHIGIILDYLHERRLEPCARTVPAAILTCFAFMEKVGGVRPAERLSDSPVLKNTVNQLTADLESKAPPRRKAPMMPVALIGAMELAVSDIALPCYLRCFAFYKLVKLWTASRCGDMCGLDPATLRLTDLGLSGMLDRTKTSGPGKRMRFLPIFISAHAFVMNPSWLTDGWALWCSPDMQFKRDYFLPLPNADESGVRHVMADYAAVVSLSKRLLTMLQVPSWNGSAWVPGGPLFQQRASLSFWTEHSERNWLASILAALGVPREKRDYVGRWRVISASDEYIRTAQFLVISLQEEALRGLTQDERWNLRNGNLDDLNLFLVDRGVSQDDAQREVRALQLPTQWHGLSNLTVASDLAKIPTPEEPPTGGDAPYFIAVVGKSRVRRLHRQGGCGASTLGVQEMLPVFDISAAVYDFACRHCWQKRRHAGPAGCPDDSTSSCSDSSESSSSSSADADVTH